MKIKGKVWVIILVSAILLFGSFKTIKHKFKTLSRNYENALIVLDDSIRLVENDNVLMASKIASMELTEDQYKTIADDILKKNDHLEGVIKKKDDIISYLEGEIEAKGKDTVNLQDTIYVIGADTIQSKHLDYNNGYLTIDGMVYNNTFDFEYGYKVAFTYTNYWEKQGLFKPDKAYVSLILEDPNAKIITATSLIIVADPPKYYQTTLFKFGAGFISGFILSSSLN